MYMQDGSDQYIIILLISAKKVGILVVLVGHCVYVLLRIRIHES